MERGIELVGWVERERQAFDEVLFGLWGREELEVVVGRRREWRVGEGGERSKRSMKPRRWCRCRRCWRLKLLLLLVLNDELNEPCSETSCSEEREREVSRVCLSRAR